MSRVCLTVQEMTLGDSVPSWFTDDHALDAMTSFGVRLWSPSLRSWCEISVLGAAHQPRSQHRSVAKRLLAPFSNQLEDGSIIDICGVSMLFQSPVSMARQCQVGGLVIGVERLSRTLRPPSLN